MHQPCTHSFLHDCWLVRWQLRLRQVYPEVRRRMRPERQHVVMDVDGGEFVHFVSSYEQK